MRKKQKPELKSQLLKLRKIFSLVLCLIIFVSVSVYADSNRNDLIKNARHLSWDGDYEAAMVIYEQLLKNDPKDIEAANGLATVTAWSGDHEKATQLFKDILKQHPANRDALLGLGRVFFWQQKLRQSLDTFDKLLAIYPDDGEAIKARGKVLQAKEAKTRFKLRIGYEYQDLSFTSNGYDSNILISFDEPKKWGIRTGFNYIKKFDDSAPVYSMGGNYWVAGKTALSLDVEFAPEQDIVPIQAYTFEVSQAAFKTLVTSLGYRFANYSKADVHILIPGLTWYFYPRFDWMVRYYLSSSQFDGQEATNHSGMTLLNWNVLDPLAFFIGYALANESFDSGNPTGPLSDFSANHFFTGFRWKIYKRVEIDFTFDYEERDNGSTLNTYNTSVSYRW